MKKDNREIPPAVIQGGEGKFTWLKDIRELSIGELVELYAYSEAIVETVREPLLVLDNNLRIKSANLAFFTTFQTTKRATYDKFIYDLNGGEWNIPSLRKLLAEILPRNSYFNDYEVTHDFKKIGHKTMLLNARRIVLEENKTEMILLAIEDITERKRLEKLKDEFINIASHEIKTPITAIKTYTQLMEKRLKKIGSEKDNEIIQNVISQADKLTDIVNRLLTRGKVEQGKKTLIKKKINLNSLVERVVKDFQNTHDEYTFIVERASKVVVVVDEVSIEQLLINLLTNAVKYSPPHEKIIIRIEKQKDEVIISIKDNGIGVAKEDMLKIFERYYRTGKKDVKGFGLGLYIAKQIVLQHDGRIWVESEKGKGSTFYFSLPLK